ncbi:hypothetical protein PFISCL1PPCAC_20858, partial [Pristionchus fissidentatus]
DDGTITMARPFSEYPLMISISYPPTDNDLDIIRASCGDEFTAQLNCIHKFAEVARQFKYTGSA